MNGQYGASSCEMVVRHSWSVACAAGSDDFQNRGRDRRTYQFDRSSTSSASACAPLNESKASSESVTVRVVRCNRERIQRSRTCCDPAGAGEVGCGQASMLAYVTKNEYTFHRVRRNWRVDSSMPSTKTRFGVHGDPDENMYQRSASAPRSCSTDHGSMMLPRDFDIFRPSPSMMWARHTTLRYGVRSNTSVLTASSE